MPEYVKFDSLKEYLEIMDAARKWDRFVGIQSCNDCPACPECPCDYTNCPALKIENAITKEPT